MLGYRKRIELAQMRLSKLPVTTHLRKEVVRKKNVNYEASKLGGKLGRKAAGL